MPLNRKMYRKKSTASAARRKGEMTVLYKHKGMTYYQNKRR